MAPVITRRAVGDRPARRPPTHATAHQHPGEGTEPPRGLSRPPPRGAGSPSWRPIHDLSAPHARHPGIADASSMHGTSGLCERHRRAKGTAPERAGDGAVAVPTVDLMTSGASPACSGERACRLRGRHLLDAVRWTIRSMRTAASSSSFASSSRLATSAVAVGVTLASKRSSDPGRERPEPAGGGRPYRAHGMALPEHRSMGAHIRYRMTPPSTG